MLQFCYLKFLGTQKVLEAMTGYFSTTQNCLWFINLTKLQLSCDADEAAKSEMPVVLMSKYE